MSASRLAGEPDKALCRNARAVQNRLEQARKSQQLFSQAPKPDFGQVPYDSPSIFPLFDIRKADADEFAPQSPERVVALTEKIRDQAAAQLKKGLPDRAALIDRVFVGRDANEADKAQRIRITPLPSIGHPQAEQLDQARACRRAAGLSDRAGRHRLGVFWPRARFRPGDR